MKFLRLDHCDKEIIDYEKSYRIMSCIGLFSIIINFPMFWSFEWDSDLPCKLSELYSNEAFHLLALTLPHIIIRFILPTIFLIYVNFWLTVKSCLWLSGLLKNLEVSWFLSTCSASPVLGVTASTGIGLRSWAAGNTSEHSWPQFPQTSAP